MDASVDLARMMSAMDRLPDEQREVVALILIEGFGYREAAEMLDIPMGTVASRLVRGRTALLELVGAAHAD
jgi:RNA polymerase sigma-70 factor (ECF subfamily)